MNYIIAFSHNPKALLEVKPIGEYPSHSQQREVQ